MKQRHLTIKSPTEGIPDGLFSFPAKIIRGEGVLKQACCVFPGKKTMIMADSFIMKNFCIGMDGAGDADYFIFKGEASPAEFYRASREMRRTGAEVVIAAGGGKAIDLAKFAVSKAPGTKLVAVPTSASTCSAMTAVSVIYDGQGKYINTVDVNAPDAVVMDYSVFYSLPKVFFAAGAVDSAAKYYETACYGAGAKFRTADDALVLELAKAVFTDTEKALRNWQNLSNNDIRALAEANIFGSGAVSAAGALSMTSSAAHGISAALTAVPEATEFLHGEHVGIGLLVQETMLAKSENISAVSAMLEKLEMPLSLKEIGVKKEDIPVICGFYQRIKAKEKFYVPIDESMMYNILESLL